MYPALKDGAIDITICKQIANRIIKNTGLQIQPLFDLVFILFEELAAVFFQVLHIFRSGLIDVRMYIGTGQVSVDANVLARGW